MILTSGARVGGSAKRRRASRSWLVGVVASLAFAPAASAQPNVLLIVTDDQRWDTLRYMPTVTSELVGKGVTFENAFAVNPICCPSRASILTGQWSHSTGVWKVFPPHGGFPTFDDSSTLATWLNDAGYETMLAGKYLNAYGSKWTQPTYAPPGWDRWLAFWTTGTCGCPFFRVRFTDGAHAWAAPRDRYSTDLLADRAEAFVREARRPFFLYLAPAAPHPPAIPAPRHAGTFADLAGFRNPATRERNLRDKPSYVRRAKTGDLQALRRVQLESLLAVDEMVDGLLTALEETGRLRDTLIVFTSDNGYLWGEHGLGSKARPYEPSIRVPLVIRWGASGLRPRRVSKSALNVDLAPTVAAAAGVGAPGAEGRNLLPLMNGTARSWRRSFIIETPGKVDFCGFRGERWKYVQYRTGEEELYNVRRDPYELHSKHRAKRSLVMAFRGRVRRSECRPPGRFRPLRACSRLGTDGPDRIHGSRRRDWICAGGGHDRINVRHGGRDTVRCGPGSDRVRADRGDRLHGCERRGPRLRL